MVDLAEFRLAKEVPVGGSPTLIASSLSGNAAYALTPQTGSVHRIDSSSQRVTSRKIADELTGLRLTDDGKRLWTANPGSAELLGLDSVSMKVNQRLKLPGAPVDVDVAPDGTVAVSTGQHGSIELFDGRTGRQHRAELGGAIGALKFRSDGKLLLLANRKEQSISVLAVPDLQVVVELPLAMQPQNLCFKPDGGQLFVSGEGMDGVAIVFPFPPLEVEQTVLAGRDPGAMACSDSSGYLFVASASGSDICILSVASRKMIGIVEVGQRPCYIAVTPDDQYALVLNERSGDMAIIRIASIQAKMSNAAKMRGKAGASLFTLLPVGSKPVHAAIVPRA